MMCCCYRVTTLDAVRSIRFELPFDTSRAQPEELLWMHVAQIFINGFEFQLKINTIYGVDWFLPEISV